MRLSAKLDEPGRSKGADQVFINGSKLNAAATALAAFEIAAGNAVTATIYSDACGPATWRQVIDASGNRETVNLTVITGGWFYMIKFARLACIAKRGPDCRQTYTLYGELAFSESMLDVEESGRRFCQSVTLTKVSE